MGDRYLNTVVSVVRNSMSNSYRNVFGSILGLRFCILSSEGLIDRFTISEPNLGINGVNHRLLDFLGVDLPSWNNVILLSNTAGLSWRQVNNLFRMYFVRAINIIYLYGFLVFNRLDEFLGGDGVSWDSDLSYNGIVLVLNWVDNRVEGSSDLWGSNDLDGLSVLSYDRLDIFISYDGVTLNIKVFYVSLVSSLKREGHGVSFLGGTW